MMKSITHFLIIFFIIQQLKSQISKIDQNGYNPFFDETLHLYVLTLICTDVIFLKFMILFMNKLFYFAFLFMPHLILMSTYSPMLLSMTGE